MKKFMNKSKKLSKNKKPEFIVVIFYGAFAVGKYTVAKEFQKETKFHFFHNHHTTDLVWELFERGTLPSARLTERLRLTVFEEIAKTKINVVTTHAYSADFVSKTGVTDPQFVKKIQSIVEKEGGVCYFVHLTATPSVLLKRVSNPSRKKFRKLVDPKIMQNVLNDKNRDFATPAPIKYNIEIDNSNLSPKQVVKKVLNVISEDVKF